MQKNRDKSKKILNKVILAQRTLRWTKASRGEIELPKPKSFPISLEHLLRLIMPRKRAADRLEIYREQLRFILAPDGNTIIEHTEEQMDEIIKNKQIRQFNKGQYEISATAILKFLPRYEAKQRQARAKAGAAGLIKKKQEYGDSKKS